MPARVPVASVPLILALLVGACGSAEPASTEPVATAPAAELPSPFVPPGAPVAAWDFDRGDAGDPGDGLTFVGGHEFADRSVVLDGATGYGGSGATGPLDTTSAFTVMAWAGPARMSPFATVVSQIGDEAAAFYLGLAEDGWAFSMKDADTNEPGHTIRAVAAGRAVEPGAWTHVAGVFDPAEGEIRLYLDGDPVASATFTDPWRAEGELRVGGSQAHAAPADFWPGAIHTVAAYQAALPDESIAMLSAASRPSTAPPALADDEPTAGAALRGTWDAVLTDAEVNRLATMFGATAAEVGIPGAETAIRYGFDGNRWWLGFVFDGTLWLVDGVPEGDGGVMAVQGDEMRQTNGRDGWITYRWAIDGDELTLTLEACVPQDGSGECEDVDVVRFMTERTFVRSGSDPSY